MTGLFVVIEGPDGSGKSTVAEGIARHFEGAGVDVVHTREPGGPKISEAIRRILLDRENGEMHPRTEALLYAASRAQHVEETILPALAEDKMVVCERFVFSSLVYQGLCRRLGLDAVEAINDFATGGLQPDITLYLDSSGISALGRIRDREADRLEADEGIRASVEENYRILADHRAEELIKVDATLDKDAVLARCIEWIEKECRLR